MQEFGGYDIYRDFINYSNIMFVNGGMDPWLVGCVRSQVNENLPVFTVKDGAHHADSFLPRNDDSGSLKSVRR